MSNNLENLMEDFALEPVPQHVRRPWKEIAVIQVGISSSLAVLMTGGLVTFMAGFWMGMLAAFISFLVSTFFTYSLGLISLRDGYSSNIISRAYAFGTRGSTLGSLIWAFMIIGFLGMESVLIGNSLLFYFHIEPSTGINILMYVLMAALWVVLSLFGMKVVAKVAQIMVPLLFLMLLYIVVLLLGKGSLADAFTHGIMIPNMPLSQGFATAMNATITLAGLLSIVAADFTRFSRSPKDVAKISVTGNLAMYGLTMIFGAVITFFGFQTTFDYFTQTGMDAAAAGTAAITNPGITLVLTAGFLGLLTIFFSQSKVQVGNSYEGALALVNLFDAAFRWKPGRAVMVVLANILALAFIFGNILHYIETFLTLGSVLLCVWVTIVLTDYYMVRGKMKKGAQGIDSLENIPQFNWNGIITLIVSTIVGMWVNSMGWFPVPFVISTIFAFVMYTVIGSLQKPVTAPQNSTLDNQSL